MTIGRPVIKFLFNTLSAGTGALWGRRLAEEELNEDVKRARELFRSVPKSSRSLAPGETELLRRLFGASLDLTDVRIHFYTKRYKDNAMTVLGGDGHNIHVFTRNHRSDDYSREQDRFRFGAFVKMATNLWRNQMKKVCSTGDYEGHNYNLAKGIRFRDYSPALQGSLMKDYALRFLHPSHQGVWLAEKWGADNEEADNGLRRVVEDQFPAAKIAREAQVAIRPLQQGEALLLRAFFGDQIDPSIVRVHSVPWKCVGPNGKYTAATVRSERDIFFHGRNYSSEDYSREDDRFNFTIFMHEATHVWQFQAQWKLTNFRFVNPSDVYAFPLDVTKWKFTDYGTEQQAAMVEDYAGYFLHPERTARRTHDGDMEQLRTVVENQFPKAKRLREYFEFYHELPGPGVMAAGVAPQPAKPAQGPS